MKTLIVYYSLEGNTKYAADKIAQAIGADTLQLVPKKAYSDKGFSKFLWGGKSALMAEKPELEPFDANLDEYEQIVFGFPVWAGTFAPPLRTFIEDHQAELQGKKIAAFACQSGMGGEKAIEKLRALIGAEKLEAAAVFRDPKGKPSQDKDAQIAAFSEKL